MFQHVRHRQTDPSDCSCNSCANSPDHSRGSTKNEQHSYDYDWTDLSAECEVVYGGDSSAQNQPDSGACRNITLRFHENLLCVTKSPRVNRNCCNQASTLIDLDLGSLPQNVQGGTTSDVLTRVGILPIITTVLLQCAVSHRKSTPPVAFQTNHRLLKAQWKFGAGRGNRTPTELSPLRILSPLRLPISPSRPAITLRDITPPTQP
jgi:hypothetical protein